MKKFTLNNSYYCDKCRFESWEQLWGQEQNTQMLQNSGGVIDQNTKRSKYVQKNTS